MNRLLLLAVIGCVGCEQTFNLTPTSPTAPNDTPSININNTNINVNGGDRSDTDNDDTTPPNDSNIVLPLPAYGETVTRNVATHNPTLLANSCQDKFGESAWQFLDKVVAELKSHSGDTRWGYLCKDTTCTKTSRDVVAYRASNTGIWIVDVIGNHCPLSGEITEVRWGVLPFETVRGWSAVHK